MKETPRQRKPIGERTATACANAWGVERVLVETDGALRIRDRSHLQLLLLEKRRLKHRPLLEQLPE